MFRFTTALRTLTTVDLFYFILREDPHKMKPHRNSIWLRARSHMISHYTWGSLSTLHDFESVFGWRALDTFLWALTISWSRLVWGVKSRALHWVPIPMPMGFGWAWVGYYLFMGGHGRDIIGNIIGNVTIFEYMGAIWIAWMDMDGHRSCHAMGGHGWA